MSRLIRHVIKQWFLYALLAFGVILLIVYWSDINRLFGSQEAIEATVQSWGALGPIVFVIINTLQVIVAPIPGTVVGVAGGYLFGVWLGFLLNLLGILLGSLVAFGLARRFGKPLVDRFVGERTSRFLNRVAERNGIMGLTLVYLLPFLPDDALSFVAGLTPLPWRTFVLIVIIGRSPGTFVASLTGAGLVDLPLWAWVIVGLAGISLLVVWWRKGEAIETWFRGLFRADRKSEPEPSGEDSSSA